MLEEIYRQQLRLAAIEERIRRAKDKPIGTYSPSDAGLCIRKAFFNANQFPVDEDNDDALQRMQIGTIIHKDIYDEFVRSATYKKIVRGMIEFPTKGEISGIPLMGTVDVIMIIEDDDITIYNVYDIKSTSSLKYIPNIHHIIQVSTYKLLLNQVIGRDDTPMKEQYTIITNLLYVNKISGEKRTIFEDSDTILSWTNMAVKYWEDVYESTDGNIKLPDKGSDGCPFEEWECKYCNYTDVCKLCQFVDKATINNFEGRLIATETKRKKQILEEL